MVNTVLEVLREFSKVKLQTNQILPTLAPCKVESWKFLLVESAVLNQHIIRM